MGPFPSLIISINILLLFLKESILPRKRPQTAPSEVMQELIISLWIYKRVFVFSNSFWKNGKLKAQIY